MKYTLSISAALLLAMSQAQPSLAQNGASNLVKQAIAAEGGADALRALKGLAIKGEAKFWEPGQSKVAGGEPKLLGRGHVHDHLGSRQRHGAHRVGS